MATKIAPLSGRRAQAARNDQLILQAAREVFVADPTAPIAAVAKRAGVGISALYRRYPSKDELLQRLASDGMQRYIAVAEAALAGDRDRWTAFAEFMHRALDAGAGSLSARFAGTFSTTDELRRLGAEAYQVTQQLLDRTEATGALRADIEVGDISLLFEQLQAVRVNDPERVRRLRHRYLALILDGLHEPSEDELPGPPPTWQEISSRYES